MEKALEDYLNNICCDIDDITKDLRLTPLNVTKGFLSPTGKPTDAPYLPVGLADDATNVVYPNIQRGYNFKIQNIGTSNFLDIPIQLSEDAQFINNSYAVQLAGGGTISNYDAVAKILYVNLPPNSFLDYSIRGEVTLEGGRIRLGNNADIVAGLELPVTYPANSGGRGYIGNKVNLKATSTIGSLTAQVTGTMGRSSIFNGGNGLSGPATTLGIDQTFNSTYQVTAFSMIKLGGVFVYLRPSLTAVMPVYNYGNTIREIADHTNTLINPRLGTANGSAFLTSTVTYPLNTNLGKQVQPVLEVHTWYSLTGNEDNYTHRYDRVNNIVTTSNYQTNDTAVNDTDPYLYTGLAPDCIMFYDSSILLDNI